VRFVIDCRAPTFEVQWPLETRAWFRHRRKPTTKPGLGIGDWGPGPVRRGQGPPIGPGPGRSCHPASPLQIGRDESGWWMGNMRRRRRIRCVHSKWIRIAGRGRRASTSSRRRVRRRLPEGRASRHGNRRRRGREECGRTRFPDSLLMSVPCKTSRSCFNEISIHREPEY